MNAYDYIQKFAEAVRDDAAVLAYCILHFGKGLQVQIDDDGEDPITSEKTPYFCLHAVTGSDDSPVSEGSDIKLRVEVGTQPSGDAPYYSDTTDRTAAANGLRVYGAGEKAVDLLDLCMTAIRAVNISASDMMVTSTIEADGILMFPLQIASSSIGITQTNDLSSF